MPGPGYVAAIDLATCPIRSHIIYQIPMRGMKYWINQRDIFLNISCRANYHSERLTPTSIPYAIAIRVRLVRIVSIGTVVDGIGDAITIHVIGSAIHLKLHGLRLGEVSLVYHLHRAKEIVINRPPLGNRPFIVTCDVDHHLITIISCLISCPLAYCYIFLCLYQRTPAIIETPYPGVSRTVLLTGPCVPNRERRADVATHHGKVVVCQCGIPIDPHKNLCLSQIAPLHDDPWGLGHPRLAAIQYPYMLADCIALRVAGGNVAYGAIAWNLHPTHIY